MACAVQQLTMRHVVRSIGGWAGSAPPACEMREMGTDQECDLFVTADTLTEVRNTSRCVVERHDGEVCGWDRQHVAEDPVDVIVANP